VLSEEMREKDEKLVGYIKSIKFSQDGFNQTFVFEFAENPYISNSTLTKTIFMLNEEQPLYSEATKIEWKAEDFTKKTIKKKQKNKKTGQTRVVEKTVVDESLFNFFNSVDIREEAME
jgi:nucleosome assembly protein 1-like 1